MECLQCQHENRRKANVGSVHAVAPPEKGGDMEGMIHG